MTRRAAAAARRPNPAPPAGLQESFAVQQDGRGDTVAQVLTWYGGGRDASLLLYGDEVLGVRAADFWVGKAHWDRALGAMRVVPRRGIDLVLAPDTLAPLDRTELARLEIGEMVLLYAMCERMRELFGYGPRLNPRGGRGNPARYQHVANPRYRHGQSTFYAGGVGLAMAAADGLPLPPALRDALDLADRAGWFVRLEVRDLGGIEVNVSNLEVPATPSVQRALAGAGLQPLDLGRIAIYRGMLANGRVLPRANPAAGFVLPPTARLEVYRGHRNQSLRLRVQGVTPRHVWLRASLGVSQDGGAVGRVSFDLDRDDDRRVTVLNAQASGDLLPSGEVAWDDAARQVADRPGVNHLRKVSGWMPGKNTRTPWLIHEYGALYDWMTEQLRALLPKDPNQSLYYDVPTSELPHVALARTRLPGER